MFCGLMRRRIACFVRVEPILARSQRVWHRRGDFLPPALGLETTAVRQIKRPGLRQLHGQDGREAVLQ